jgi:hypothetical protein
VWQDKPATAARRRLLDRLRDLFQGSASTRKLYRQRLLDLNPVTWLVSRDRLKTLYPWCFLLAALALWLSGLAWLRKDWLSVPATVMTMILIHGAFRLWIGSEAARRFSDDLRSGALELVLSSSLKLDEILGGQLLALRRQFLRASIAVLGGDVALLLLCLGSGQNLNGQEIIELCVAVVAGMIMFVADMFTLGWVGMWHGISARDPNRASGSAAGQILLLPWAYLSALWTCYGVFYGLCLAGGARVPSPSFGLVLFTWFAIGIGNDLFFWRRSRKRLREEFRSLAMRRYSGTEDKSFLQMLAAFLWRGNAGR